MENLIRETGLKARALLGDCALAEDETALCAACRTACTELVSRLRAGVRAEAIAAVFTDAAAYLAVSVYTELNTGAENGLGYIKAGSLTISRSSSSGLKCADAFRKRAETMLAPYLKAGDFAFAGVDG